MHVAAVPLISFTQLLLRKDIQIFSSAYSTHFMQWNTCKGRREAEESREIDCCQPGRETLTLQAGDKQQSHLQHANQLLHFHSEAKEVPFRNFQKYYNYKEV